MVVTLYDDLCVAVSMINPLIISLLCCRQFITNPATGQIYKLGETMYRLKLARTLEIIANEGPYAFYNGSLAENITLDIQEAGRRRIHAPKFGLVHD